MSIARTIKCMSMALAVAAPAALAQAVPALACLEGSPSVVVEHSRAIVLRMETMGGLATLPALLLRVPTFTLYEDGLAIFRPSNAPLMRVELDREHTARLIEFALQEGGLADAHPEYVSGGIADATTTVFTLAADGLEKRVSVHALGNQVRGPDRAAYEAFGRLAAILAEFGSWLPDDARIEPYVPEAYLGIFAEEDPQRPDLTDWPWDDLEPADLVPFEEAPFFRTVVLTPDQVAEIALSPVGEDTVAYVAGSDGDAYRVMIKPLLPGERPPPEVGDQA